MWMRLNATPLAKKIVKSVRNPWGRDLLRPHSKSSNRQIVKSHTITYNHIQRCFTPFPVQRAWAAHLRCPRTVPAWFHLACVKEDSSMQHRVRTASTCSICQRQGLQRLASMAHGRCYPPSHARYHRRHRVGGKSSGDGGSTGAGGREPGKFLRSGSCRAPSGLHETASRRNSALFPIWVAREAPSWMPSCTASQPGNCPATS